LKKAEVQEIEDLYESIVDLFDRKCWICGESYDKKNKKGKRKAFTLHHRIYPDNEKKYSDFTYTTKTGKEVYDKLNYLRYLIPIIQKLSKVQANERFRLLHHSHHYVSEKWARYKPDNFEKMVELARETINLKRVVL